MDEVFRDFLIFRMNHRKEVLFKHDYFTGIMSQEYSIPHCCLNTNTDLLNVISNDPISHFVNVLRQCERYVSTRDAREDLCLLLSYATEAL